MGPDEDAERKKNRFDLNSPFFLLQDLSQVAIIIIPFKV
jgi:hypothetical protein